jgi:hypothetical protein
MTLSKERLKILFAIYLAHKSMMEMEIHTRAFGMPFFLFYLNTA